MRCFFTLLYYWQVRNLWNFLLADCILYQSEENLCLSKHCVNRFLLFLYLLVLIGLISCDNSKLPVSIGSSIDDAYQVFDKKNVISFDNQLLISGKDKNYIAVIDDSNKVKISKIINQLNSTTRKSSIWIKILLEKR